MAMNLRQLRHVTLLAEAGNFSRAAELAGVTQPALSRSVGKLEAEIGFKLFDRTPGGVIPSVVGEQFIKDAARLLTQARQLEVDARALADGQGGTLTLGLGPLLSSLIVPELLSVLAARFPRLRINIMTANALDLMEALAERRVELCLFSEGLQASPRMATRRIGSLTISLLVRAGHPLAGRSDLCLEDIKDFPLATGSFSGRSIGTVKQPEPSIICENYHVLRDMVQNSDTIWFSSRALRVSGNRQDLIELDVKDYPSTEYGVLLARMEQRTPSPASKVAESAIEAILRRATQTDRPYGSGDPRST